MQMKLYRKKRSRSEIVVETPVKTIVPKADSPPIVDDSKATSSSASGQYDIEALINIHGEKFKKCPYSQTIAEKKDAAAFVKDCPIHMPVGQDVMGECPYVDTIQKVRSIGEMSPNLSEGDIANCPFFSSAKLDSTKIETEVKKCPFISETQSGAGDTIIVNDTTEQTLYCGLYRHDCYRLDLFEKCEALGKSLAASLIENGALKVMSKAQTEIRQKI